MTKTKITYKEYQAKEMDPEVLSVYLKEMDPHYVPPISTTVEDIEHYAHKLCENAFIIGAYSEEDELIGIFATYVNQSFGFISSGSVKQKWSGQGVFRPMMLRTIDLSKELGHTYLELEIFDLQHILVDFYLRLGYVIEKVEDKEQGQLNTMRFYHK